MLYQAEGTLRNISIDEFCMNNDVNYNEFFKWYKSMRYGIYELQIDGRSDTYKKNAFPETHASSVLQNVVVVKAI